MATLYIDGPLETIKSVIDILQPETLWFILFVVIVGLLTFFINIHFLKWNIQRISDYLAQQTATTKDKQYIKYYLLSSLKTMKKYIGLSMLAIVFAMIAAAGFIVYDSRDYFRDYFQVKQQKLNLRNEASVDSLQNLINEKTKVIDSLSVSIETEKGINRQIQLNLTKQMLLQNKLSKKQLEYIQSLENI